MVVNWYPMSAKIFLRAVEDEPKISWKTKELHGTLYPKKNNNIANYAKGFQ